MRGPPQALLPDDASRCPDQVADAFGSGLSLFEGPVEDCRWFQTWRTQGGSKQGGGSYSQRIRSRMKPTCKIEGCCKPVDSHGMCGMHAQRVRRYGDPHHVTSKDEWRRRCREAALTRWADQVKESTYRKLHNRHAHRVIAEQMLGRPLRKGEIVHHIDGNKHNNDPANLQVMTQSEHIALHRAEMQESLKRAREEGSNA